MSACETIGVQEHAEVACQPLLGCAHSSKRVAGAAISLSFAPPWRVREPSKPLTYRSHKPGHRRVRRMHFDGVHLEPQQGGPDTRQDANDQSQRELTAQIAPQHPRDVVLEEQRLGAVLSRDGGEAPLTKSRTIDEQIQGDDQGQDDIEDHSADLSQGTHQVLQDVGPAPFDGGGGLRLELVQVSLDAVLAQRSLYFGSAGLEVVGVLR